jgi:1-aminocyclopropane-1-carboxylate deaminase/D-cysteine desulfhydrase-like pyridoxal-dependent ACC family enzyme
LAGLLAGAKTLGLEVQVHGVAASTRLVDPARVSRLANRALRVLGVETRVRPAEVEVAFDLLGEGHGRPPAQAREVLREQQALGHELDPIFTARALAWLKSRARPGESWLFWHTGVAVK